MGILKNALAGASAAMLSGRREYIDLKNIRPEHDALGLYVHVPLCRRSCTYCGAYRIRDDPDLRKGLVRSLKREIPAAETVMRGKKANYLFFGGGTPGLLEPDELEEILDPLQAYGISGSIKTIEASPEDTDRKKLDVYRKAGFNRMSFGVQSFAEDERRIIGRGRLDTGLLEEAIAGFDVNIDLISCMPGQSRQNLMYSLKKAVDVQPQQITVSVYIPVAGTVMGKVNERNGKSIMDRIRTYLDVCSFMARNGYEQTEVFAFRRKGAPDIGEYRPKISDQEFLGFGPGAFSLAGGFMFSSRADVNSYMREVEETGISKRYGIRFAGPVRTAHRLAEKSGRNMNSSNTSRAIAFLQRNFIYNVVGEINLMRE